MIYKEDVLKGAKWGVVVGLAGVLVMLAVDHFTGPKAFPPFAVVKAKTVIPDIAFFPDTTAFLIKPGDTARIRHLAESQGLQAYSTKEWDEPERKMYYMHYRRLEEGEGFSIYAIPRGLVFNITSGHAEWFVVGNYGARFIKGDLYISDSNFYFVTDSSKKEYSRSFELNSTTDGKGPDIEVGKETIKSVNDSI